jgi:hypothetical protein
MIILPFGWRKRIYKFRQTDLEKTLEQGTFEAIDDIAHKLDIPHQVYAGNLPIVKYNPPDRDSILSLCFEGTTAYNMVLNQISYGRKDPTAIDHYEESGHFLHYQINDKKSQKSDGLNSFFSHVIDESVGYFCSLLSGERRDQTIENERAIIQSGPVKIEELLKERQKMTPGSLDEAFSKMQEAGIRRSLIRTEYSLNRTEEIIDVIRFYASEDPLAKEELEKLEVLKEKNGTIYFSLPEKLRGVYAQIIVFGTDTNDVLQSYNNVHHDLGYEIGDMAFKLYSQDPAKGKALIKHLMQVPKNQSFVELAKSYRVLSQKSYCWHRDPFGVTTQESEYRERFIYYDIYNILLRL